MSANFWEERREDLDSSPEKDNESATDSSPEEVPEGYENPSDHVMYGDTIAVWWDGDDQFYKATVKHELDNGKHRIEYADGEVRYHHLDREVFYFYDVALERLLKNLRLYGRKNRQLGAPAIYSELASYARLGDEVLIYWARERTFFKGRITEWDAESEHVVSYDDGDVETINFEEKVFRFAGHAAIRVYSTLIRLLG